MPIQVNTHSIHWGLFVLLLIAMVHSSRIHAEGDVERLFWDKTPLNVTLTVGQERLVSFPAGVRVGIPGALTAKLRTQSNAGTVYWQAREAFEPHRIEVREIEGPGIYLIDLSAVKPQGLPNRPLEIQRRQEQRPAQIVSGSSKRKRRSPTLGRVALTRFAAQQLYAPVRLTQKSAHIHRVSVSSKPLTQLLRGANIQAQPLASWHSGALYVTAVALSNHSRDFITLDPRALRGRWQAATFQHTRLHPTGTEADTTTLYLISDRPFHEAL